MELGHVVLESSLGSGRVVTVGTFVGEVGRHVLVQFGQGVVLEAAQVTLVPTAGRAVVVDGGGEGATTARRRRDHG